MTEVVKRKRAKKYNIGLSNFICDKVSEGTTVAEICRKYPEAMPAEKTIYDWRKKYPEFKNALTEAYQTLIYKQMDELNDLSKQLLEEDTNSNEDINEAKLSAIKNRDRRDNIRVRIDAIKFSLSHLAPKLVPELKDQQVKAQFNLPAIQIINYSDIKEDNTKLIEGN